MAAPTISPPPAAVLRQNRWAVWALIPSIALTALAIVLGVGYLATPDPLVYRNSPFPVAGPVHAGDILKVTVSRCNNEGRPLAYSFVRDLVNDRTGARYNLPAGAALMDPGCSVTESNLNGIPGDLPPGWYHLEGITHAEGQWRTVSPHWRTASFEVISRDDPRPVTPAPTPTPSFPTPIPPTPTAPGSAQTPATGPSGPPGPPGPSGPPGPTPRPTPTPSPTPTPTPTPGLPVPTPCLPPLCR